jgi:putative hemolysin
MALTLPALLLGLAALGMLAGCHVIELTIFSLSDARIRALNAEGFRGSAELARLRAQPRRVLALLRGAKVLSAAGAAGLAGGLGYIWGGPSGVVVGIVVTAALMLVGAELLPLWLASRHNVRLALKLAPLVLGWSTALAPVLSPFASAPHVLLYSGPAVGPGAESEIRQISNLGQTEGLIEEPERQLLERALRLDESKAWDIMTPRVDIFAWPDSKTLSDVADQFGSVPYSRVPVYGDSIDDVSGILYMRDAYQALFAGRQNLTLKALAREPLVVPGSISLTRLLREFQTRRIHLALVVDEYGGTDGLVTLEDILEELVGEIHDETDISADNIERLSAEELIAAGDADLREINHILPASLPQLEHRSLNGYLLEELGRVPAVGEVLEREGVLIEVLEATDTQVLRARLRRLPPSAPLAGADEGAVSGMVT